MWAINPIHWFATSDGWLDPASGPDLPTLLEQVRIAGFQAMHAAVPTGMSSISYRALLADYDVAPAPGYMTIIHEEDDESALCNVADLQKAAATHAELGLQDMFVALKMNKNHPRVAIHAAEGYLADNVRLQRLSELFAKASEHVRSEGIRPLLHPHVGTWIETEPETRYILDHVDSDLLGFGPDIGHLSWSGADVSGLFEDFSDRIGAVHVKDINLTVMNSCRVKRLAYCDTVTQGLWAAPGQGQLPLHHYLSHLSLTKPTWLISEVDWVDKNPFQAARASAEWFEDMAKKEGI